MYHKVELYTEPENILYKMEEGYCEMTTSDLGFLCGLIKQENPQKVLEVGVAGGGTTAVIMNCLHLLNSNAKMYSVDINKECYRSEDKETGYQLKQVKDELNNYVNHKFELGYVLPEVIDKIGNNIDFVILDTVHSLPGELLDFLCVVPYLKEDAIVVLHDVASNLNFKREAFATKIVLSAASGEKYYNYEDEILNIAAIRVCDFTKENIANIFSALSISWAYLPSDAEVKLYRDLYIRHYDDECIRLFDLFSEANKKCVKERINQTKYNFVESKLIKSIYYKDELSVDKAREHFMNYNSEVIYVLDSIGTIEGVISVGDLCRYYENQDSNLRINNNFRCIDSCDYEKAEEIFKSIKTIHEIPVVINNQLIGVIKKEINKGKDEWEILRRRLLHGKLNKGGI